MSLEHAWIDIAAPPSPADPASVGLLLALLLGVVGVALVVWWQRHRTAAARARRRLRRATRHLARQNALDADTAKRVARGIRRQLRSGLGRTDLGAMPWPPPAHAAWQAYLTRLSHAGFAVQAPDHAELAALLDEAQAWLMRAHEGGP